MSQTVPSAPADRFALIIEGLCQAVARRCGLGGLAGPFIILISSRLRRITARFKARVAREAAIPPIPPRTSKPRPARVRPYQPDPLPRHYAWLLILIQETAGGASQLRYFLTDPEVTALLASSPRLRGILRPLCHMLGIRPAQALSLYPPPAKPPLSPSQPPDAPPAAPPISCHAPPQAAPLAILPCATPSPAAPPSSFLSALT